MDAVRDGPSIPLKEEGDTPEETRNGGTTLSNEDAWTILVGPMSWKERRDLQLRAGAEGTPVRLPPPYESEKPFP